MHAFAALFAAGLLVFVSAAVQHLNTVGSKGLAFIFTDRAAPLSREGFAGRAARTLQNNLESAGMVVPAATILAVLGVSNALVTGAALVYAAARIGFTLSYWAGISKLRSLFWGVGMGSIAVLTAQAGLAMLMGLR
ncbi:MAPEG family protein [uncultured Devosia sp.]|uniref:MAPEG family protein n=1 Tax=uncultured Devosia sp. TaxID=211434 RepID=UPI00260FFE37|nr:MAPEG family protein [uncultured Devosia sp.]